MAALVMQQSECKD